MKWSNITLVWFIVNAIILENDIECTKNPLIILFFMGSLINFAMFIKNKMK